MTNIGKLRLKNHNFSYTKPLTKIKLNTCVFKNLTQQTTIIMDIKNNHKNETKDKQKQSDELSNTEFKPQTNEELNEEKPVKRIRRQATEEQLNNPFHGVKLVQVLERLVAYYGWEYLGERVNINCFKNNPTMKSSLGFLRRTAWAREHVEDVYLEMLDEKK